MTLLRSLELGYIKSCDVLRMGSQLPFEIWAMGRLGLSGVLESFNTVLPLTEEFCFITSLGAFESCTQV